MHSMIKSGVVLLAAAALTTVLATPLRAQDADAPATPAEAAARLEFLQAQVDALQTQLDALRKATGSATPAWRGTPEFAGPDGARFKLTGELQFDAGQVGNPGGDAIATPNLGFNSRARRLLVGAQGALPGDFSYSFTFNFAEGGIDYEDLIFEYAPRTTPFTFTVGYFYPFSSMENAINNRFLSFVERAQFNEATGNGRRLGVAATYANRAGDFRIQAGAFGEGINGNTTPSYAATSTVTPSATPGGTPTVATSIAPNTAGLYDRTGYEFAVRSVYSPQVAGAQLHLGASVQYRRFRQDALGVQYRVRPFAQTTDQRFIGTGNIAASGDAIYGVEAMVIDGAFHAAGEAQYIHVDGYRPGTVVASSKLLAGATYRQDPHFITGYGELGFWLTGETRGYRNGRGDRTKIVDAVSAGGWGGLQVVARIDYIDLTADVGNTAANSLGLLNGGKQIGYLGALNYWPIDYVRFTAEYAREEVTGGPFAAVVVPTNPANVARRTYGSDTFVFRAQIDF